MTKLIRLFLIFLKIGAFTLGGGYAMIPLIEEEVVHINKWIKQEEFIDIIALAQSIPGVLAVNTATYVGYKISGIKGSIFASLGAILPSFFIMIAIAKYLVTYFNNDGVIAIFKGIRPAVVSLIVAAVFRLRKGIPRNLFSLSLLIASFILVGILNVHPILVIITFGFLGYFVYKGVEDNENGI